MEMPQQGSNKTYTWQNASTTNILEEPMDTKCEYPQKELVDLYVEMDNSFILTPYEESHVILLYGKIAELLKLRLQIQKRLSKLAQETINLINQMELRHRSHPERERFYRTGLLEHVIQDAYLPNPITLFCLNCNGTLATRGHDSRIFYRPEVWHQQQQQLEYQQQQQQQQQRPNQVDSLLQQLVKEMRQK